ncbi:lipopolysaccharide biosynthesis protein [Desulfobacterota bacterium M19]
MRATSRIALNLASNWVLKLVQVVIGLILVPFLLIKLGTDGYGIIGIVGVIVSMSQLTDLGLRSGLSRHLLAARAKENDRLFNQLVSTGLITYLGIGIISAIALFSYAPGLLSVFKIPERLQPEGLFLIRYYGAWTVLFSFMLPPFTAILLAYNRFDIVNGIGGVTALLRCILLLFILTVTDWGLYGYAMIEMGVQVIKLISLRIMAAHQHPKLLILPSLYNSDALRILFLLGSKMYIFNLARFISTKADAIILTTFLGPSAVAFYNPGARLSDMAAQFVNALRSQLWTLTTDAHESNNIKKLHKVLVLGTKYTVLLGSIVSAFLFVYAMPIMEIWIGHTPVGEHFTTCAWVLICWTLAYFFDYLGGTQWSVLLGMNQLNFLVYLMSALAVINILMSVILVGYTDLGVIGVVIPTAIISIIRRPIILWHCSRLAGISPWDYIHSAYIRPLAVFALVIVSAVILAMILPTTSIWWLLTSAICLGLIWMAGCWYIGFEEIDRYLFKSLVLRFVGSVSP